MKNNDRIIRKTVKLGYGWTLEIHASLDDFTGEVNFEDLEFVSPNPKEE